MQTPEAQTRALDALRRLARALGAVPADDSELADLSVPVPGTVIREGHADVVASCPVIDPARRYSLDALERAIKETNAS